MRLHIILRYVAYVFLINALFLLVSAAISYFDSDTAFWPLLYSAVVTALFGAFPLIFVPPSRDITNNEGLVIVISSWLFSCLVGALPYVMWGGEFTFTNAWFESVSGYTTTGSSILSDIEALPLGLLFWRSATHWLGGMGIIIFVLSVLPSMGVAGLVLYRSEMSPLARDNFRHNASTTIKILLGVYLGLTVLETVALLLCGMNLFDAITHSFATIATGGFSTRNASIAYFDSVAVETVVEVFMVLSGIHFGLLFSAIFLRKSDVFRSTVVRYYVLAMLLATVIMAVDMHGVQYSSWSQSIRYAAFQLISIGTSTGFANADSSVWPPMSQILLLLFALQCACAGSTSGGIKTDRIVIFAKAVVKQIKLLQHPRAVLPIKVDGKNLHDDVLAMTLLYLSVYLAVVVVATLLLVALGVDALSAFSGTIATTGNVGPGLGSVGSTANFGHLPAMGKWILSGTMLLGRLEIYGLLIFLLPQTWTGGMSQHL